MNYRNLGRSPLQVSELCLGTMMFADQTDVAEARRIVGHAHEQGVNFIDTADNYSLGRSESMVGELLRGQRDDWIVATKLGNKMGERPNQQGYSRRWMLRECEASLRRLGMDHVDILYLHRDFNGVDLEEPLRALEALLRDGKIRYWGLSNFRGWRIAEAVHLARAIGMPQPVVCQPYYNLLNRQPEVEVLAPMPWCPTARSRAACCRASTHRAAGPPKARAPAAATSACCRPSSAPSRSRSRRSSRPIATPRAFRCRTSRAPGCWRTRRSAR
jgi:aryl-alcohol dehydrogenase-like predicted oxidoreductase